MVEQIVVKAFNELTDQEAQRLRELTREGPSEFKFWLNCRDQPDKFAAIAYQDDIIIGWAAAQYSFQFLDVGAYVQPDKRGQGIGQRVLHELVTHMKTTKTVDFISYYPPAQRFFQPVLDQLGYHL